MNLIMTYKILNILVSLYKDFFLLLMQTLLDQMD